MKNILDFNLEELKNWMAENGESKFRAKQIFEWIYKKAILNFDEMTNISKASKGKLKNSFYIDIPNIMKKYKSNIDGTEKFLFEYKDGNIIESVVMRYKHGNSICVSTQIGCRMGCKFCASTVDGVVRNLTSGEIAAQILKAQQEIGERISNVVLMGSGEPLDNYDNVLKFIKLINDDNALKIGQRHITLSTCGIVPKIKELADEKLQITLAISLHAPNDDIRKSMMPIANKYNINELLDACKYYSKITNRRITFEYALVNGINDSAKNAEELFNQLKGILCHINLIPVNEIKENDYKRSGAKDIEEFKNILIKYGIETTIRREMGSDINGACGQLRRNYIKNN
ncbi:23S rRNA (adenine(2503)-C(2))-methyltransferase RlmN [Clostridium botulinum]|uniref:Probable dual-specificity RNA methyltransferase RlmN n=1 Tax=Clostridium botulinum C/D str. DC5 TaxID=1443128 RepID=A0A0A0IM88_CLOBO|nr:23S rRNA (adenine(2503)-C(2))-methyltransferase RlmN [Clostridium botulinum]KGM94144.1 ribosomal RNA large subunit methyltransferase N [Clostridium botulinum D str. CCUG 7971]KGN01302.1 ribosomal RNA large subunit methyltransferase N [Clostridium botulinum C/D str. DC5]KOC49597.1 23S rRNA (adenine(2503)-C2)-methyltransferase [Clostridium botulinum]KOC54045.1 23S rRNA (adenine(2503)-C2)-methyltransferase [Clostridium botulinum]KOC57784.1 23S rRNA (adenine(2503)-C2)-methyltransferase [Clostri